MFKIDVIAVGKLKKGPWEELQQDYATRLRWPTTIYEVESRITNEQEQQKEEQKLILAKLDPDAYTIVLDERGQELRSLEFAEALQKIQNSGQSKATFLIGGACGLGDDIRKKANKMISFGRQTWPHLMVRIMLLEQIYRAQQIQAGHPYHREG